MGERRRLKVANALEDYGHRVQFSVFEVWLDDALRREIITRLDKLIDPEEDSVRLYHLCALCQKRVEIHGKGVKPDPPGAVII